MKNDSFNYLLQYINIHPFLYKNICSLLYKSFFPSFKLKIEFIVLKNISFMILILK